MAITGEKITEVFGGGLIAQAFGAIHDGTEALKKALGHVGDGHFGWSSRPERYDEHGYAAGGNAVFCGCGTVLVPADIDRSDDAGTEHEPSQL